jgi:type I restriction enzyme S subunit
MRRELIEAINIQAKRDGIYLPIIKAVVFEELTKKYKSKPLKDLLNDSHGGSWGEDYFEKGLEAIALRSPDIRHGYIDFVNGKRRFYEKDIFPKFQLEDGDILVIKSNGSLDLVGKSQVFISNAEYPNVTASNFLMILKPNKKEVSPLYLDAFLKSPQSLIWRVVKQRTTTGLRNLDSKGYLSLKVPLPNSKEEQNKIVDIINSLVNHEFHENDILDISKIELASKISERFNELLNEFESQKQLLSQLKQSILQEAIQGKLTADWREQNPNTEPASELLKRIKAEKDQLIKDKKIKKEKPLPPITKEEIPFELPDGWIWCRLGDINNIFLGGAAFSSSRFIPNSNIQVIRISNVKNDQLNTLKSPVYIDDKNANENLRNELFPRDILITMTGTREKRDYCFTVELNNNHFKNERLFLNQRVGCFRISPNIDSTFASLALKSQSLLQPVFESSTGSANQANISKNALLNIVFPLPPLEEQKAIVEKVENLMQKCTALEQEIKTSEANAQMLMQAVLKEAFEGKKEEVEV